jgi:TM2 domain-containing membrane protein YozV
MAECPHCGASLSPESTHCRKCGSVVTPAPSQTAPPVQQPVQIVIQVPGTPAAPAPDAPPVGSPARSRIVAGLLGIFLGALGIHRFYLGYTGIGLAQLLLSVLFGWCTAGISIFVAAIWGLIEGILILTRSMKQDAWGRPLEG